MSAPEAILLGIVQGITEFLPVSSSGHLVIFQHMLGVSESMLIFDVAVHWATLLAVVVFFREDFSRMFVQTTAYLSRYLSTKDRAELRKAYPDAVCAGYIFLATLPIAVVGFLVRMRIESLYHSIASVGLALVVLGIFLVSTRWFKPGRFSMGDMTSGRALAIGVVQCVALLPGISRSGTVIVAAMLLGFTGRDSARFSFWLAVPAILGAGILSFRDGVAFTELYSIAMVSGFASAAVVGFFAISALLKVVSRGRFYVFGYYCLALGIFVLLESQF